MSKLKIIVSLIALFIVLPIWYYLIYKVLVLVNATELMWFLFWVYLPFGIFVQTVTKFLED